MPDVDYRFMHSSKPGAYRKRNGERGTDCRTKVEWEQAFEGHVRSAHDGVADKDCNACRELRKKANR